MPKYEIQTGLAIPRIAVGGRTATSEYGFDEMPVGASFLVPIVRPDGLSDEQWTEHFKEQARKLTNRLGSATRRYKTANPQFGLPMRTVNDDTLGVGVRVWKVAAQTETQAAPPPPAPPAPPPPPAPAPAPAPGKGKGK